MHFFASRTPYKWCNEGHSVEFYLSLTMQSHDSQIDCCVFLSHDQAAVQWMSRQILNISHNMTECIVDVNCFLLSFCFQLKWAASNVNKSVDLCTQHTMHLCVRTRTPHCPTQFSIEFFWIKTHTCYVFNLNNYWFYCCKLNQNCQHNFCKRK